MNRKQPVSLEEIARNKTALEAAVAAVRAAAGNPVYPAFSDEALRQRLGVPATAQGLLASIRRQHAKDAPIPTLRHSVFRQYKRCGKRASYDTAARERSQRLDQIATAVYLGDESRLDELQDLIWAACETTCWILPAHDWALVDLGAAMLAENFARLEAVFCDKLDAEVRQRMADEVQQRILGKFLDDDDPGKRNIWGKITNNWNAVCHAGVGIAAMVFEKDPARLATIFAQLFRDLPHFFEGFTADGGCSEGPGYWRYGMQHFVRLSDALHKFTAGAVDLLGGELPARIVRYPLAVALAPGHDLSFADSRNGHLSCETAALINRYLDEPEIFTLCETGADGQPLIRTFGDLLTWPEKLPAPASDCPYARDAVLPNLGIAKLQGAAGLVLGIKAGHNGEHHNHNDVGSFLIFQDGIQYICDPGAPIYTAATFSSRRYESAFTNSRGHSVPVIAGQLQSTGSQFCGTLAVSSAAGESGKKALVEMAAAYAVSALKRLTRTVRLDPTCPTVLLEDDFEFGGDKPLAVEEAFVTTWPAELEDSGQVVIRAGAAGCCVVTAQMPGLFQVETMKDESREHPRGLLLRRIVFRPDWARAGDCRKVCLSFSLEAARNH